MCVDMQCRRMCVTRGEGGGGVACGARILRQRSLLLLLSCHVVVPLRCRLRERRGEPRGDCVRDGGGVRVVA